MRNSIYLLFALALIACKKDTSLKQTIQGKVYEQNINAGSANASVIIFSKKLSGGSINNTFTVVASTTTDSEGNYTVEFDRERTAEYKIEVSKESFFTLSSILSADVVEQSKTYTKQLNIYPIAMLEIRVNNLPPGTGANYLGFKPLDEISCACCISEGFIYKGTGDTTVFCNWYGGQNFPFKYTISNENGLKQFTDTTFLKPFENNILELNF